MPGIGRGSGAMPSADGVLQDGTTPKTYEEKQTALLAGLGRVSQFMRLLYRSSSDDQFILHYPANGSSLFILGASNDILKHDLDEGSMSKILADKLEESLVHLERLRQRVCEKSSRVLITGDVNAGKSTFVNALLGAQVLPTDQQPCTQAFCEVIPCTEVQKAKVLALKSLEDPDAVQMSLEEMQAAIQEESTEHSWYRVTWPTAQSDPRRFTAGASLDVSLIDSPGLNSDLFKTASLFSRQADIDVVIFVVNAANHLTLSARHFLERASREKDHIFLVVNRWDDIRNRDKCRKIIMEQIAQVLPRTSEEAEMLVHFVSAAEYLKGNDSEGSFARLEGCLRNFILENRTRSKLLPVQRYMIRVLADLALLLDENIQRAQQETSALQTELEMIAPCYDRLREHVIPFRQDLQALINSACLQNYSEALDRLSAFASESTASLKQPWKGLFRVHAYRREVLQQLRSDLSNTLSIIKQDSEQRTSSTLHSLQATALAHAHQIFGNGQLAPIQPVAFDINSSDIEIPELSPWDIFDFEAATGSSTSVWIGATSVGAALLGHRQLLGLGLNLATWFMPSRKQGGRASMFLLLGGGLLAASYFLLDFEAMAKKRIEEHLRETLRTDHWPASFARTLESAARECLVQSSVGLLTRFDEALSQQRRLRAEKDMEWHRSESLLAHFQQHRKSLLGLQQYISEIKLT